MLMVLCKVLYLILSSAQITWMVLNFFTIPNVRHEANPWTQEWDIPIPSENPLVPLPDTK
ncbi:unnamed protein product [Nyctereutes procyonoides]|uniref:(raccoon dog) hypothetical protein n=1 Tax=Nyctereutes procyonoides TaxID=34880 RepID=A0A811XUZ7_NYCPR|nr:unnamed protein product [Nyctereutes procyonoides]